MKHISITNSNHHLWSFLLLSFVALMMACTDQDVLNSIDSKTYTIRFAVSLNDYEGLTTRASESEFTDGDCVYVLFMDGDKSVHGTATYNGQNKLWTLQASHSLAETDESRCQLAYFTNHQGTTGLKMAVNQQTCIYSDAQAVYQLTDGVLTIQGKLAPALGRIRFKGSNAQTGTFWGLSFPQTFDLGTHALSMNAVSITVTCGSDGYSPYYYAAFANETSRLLTLELNSESGLRRSYGQNVLQPRSSGHVAIPTMEENQGWTLVNLITDAEIKLPTIAAVSVSEVTSDGAFLSSNVVSDGNGHICDVGFVWSESFNPTVDDNKKSFGKSTGTFTYRISGLTEATTYHIRAYCINEAGTAYSEDLTFTTKQEDVEVWDGSIATAFASGTGTIVDPFIIATPAQLAYIETSGQKSAWFKLKNNLDLAGLAWKPISDFAGHLDGNGKKIYHLRITRSQDNVGLISNLKLNGEIKNLSISGVSMNLTESENVGALVGQCLGNVSNCHVLLDGDSKIVGNKAVGGLIGCFGIEMYHSDLLRQVSNCSIKATTQGMQIMGTAKVGGLIGGTDLHSSANITISNCVVNASVGGNNNIGGIVGYVYNYLGKTTIEEASYEGSLMGEQGVGGIVGYAANSSGGAATYTIKACHARPTITCQERGGGLLGGTRLGSYDITASYTIVNFQNGGTTMGGLIGWQEHTDHNKTSINCCYSVIQGTGSIYGFIGKNETGSYVNLNDSYTSSSLTANSSSYLKMDNCQGGCTGDAIVSNLRDSGSPYINNWNLSNTFVVEAMTDKGQQNVICPRLAWEK